ncbi:MAG: hypothetical protein R6X15_07255 [Pseudomonadota bacterium]
MPIRYSPQFTFTLAALTGLACIALCLWLVMQAPWFGMTLDATPEQVGRVLAVNPTARAVGVDVGDKVIAFSAPGVKPVPLYPLSLINDPDHTGSFHELNRLFTHVGQLYAVTNRDITLVHLADNRIVPLPRQSRELGGVPPGWLILAAGIIPFIVSAGVWSYRRRDTVSFLLLLAGTGFMGIALSNLIYAYRQPSIDPMIFQFAVYANRLSTLLYFFMIMAIFWIYPRPLGSRRVIGFGLLLVLIIYVNELSQTIELPGDPFAFPLVLSLPFTLTLIAIQLYYSRRDPVDYAALQGFVLALMTGTILVTGLYFLPPVLGAAPVLSHEFAFAIGELGSLGLIMAVARYRLFELGTWWLTAWMWLLGGAAVLGLDLLIAYLWNLTPQTVITFSLFLVGWVYFPLRQWLWKKLFWNGHDPMKWLPRAMLEAVVASHNTTLLSANWHALLHKLFRPMLIKPLDEPVAAPAIDKEGLTLRVPDLAGENGVELTYRSDGRRLFSPADIELVSTLLQMAGPAVNVQTAREAATRKERERIMRDLHDDVCSRLLSLSHRLREGDNAEMVRHAMQALRETIYSLNRPEGEELNASLAEWHHETIERLEACNIGLKWRIAEALPEIMLTPAQRANLGQVLREAVSNAIRHAKPSSIRFDFRYTAESLHVEIRNDGECHDPALWSPGTGMMNMRRRIQDLDGKIHWSKDRDGCHIVLELPLAYPLKKSPAQDKTNLVTIARGWKNAG